MAASGDRWARWLLDARHGGDAAVRARMLESLCPWRDEILDRAGDKAAALREFYRVLRPGGRVSLFEPINRLMRDPDRPFGYDTSPVGGLAQRVRAAYESIQPPGSDPMTDFDERDLVRHAERAGFPEVSLDLRLSLKPARDPCARETFLRTSGNPLVPPLGEVMTQVLSPEECAAFTAVLRPLVESGDGQSRSAVAFLTAAKPA